jgi:protein SCO1
MRGPWQSVAPSRVALRLAVILVMAIGTALASGCGGSRPATKPYHAADISGFMPPLAFHLTGPAGQPISEQLLRGKTTLLYFGYTHCPDVCPTTLARLSAALRMLGASADGVRVLFVSVDPERDTPAVLARYASYFAPQVIGVSGTDEQLLALTKRYRVAYRRAPPDAQGNYDVYHSSAVFVFDAEGRARLLVPDTESAARLAEDLSSLSAG